METLKRQRQRITDSTENLQDLGILAYREVVQHTMAFQHLVQHFVVRDEPLIDKVIRETHEIPVRGMSGKDAGRFGTKNFGGLYRKSINTE